MAHSDKEVKMPTMDGYRRVSRVMGREGESYMSPSIQQDDIERWAAEHGITIPNLEEGGFTLEEDVSGAVPIDKRKLAKLIKRVEAGISEGVVVNHIDRFGRDKVDAALAIKRLHEAGARLVAIGEAIDTATSPSLVVDIYLSLAEEVRARACENWDNAKRRNVEVRKLHVSSKPKFGYRRRDEVEWPERPADGRLISDQPEAVKEAFKQRTIRDARLVVEPQEAEVARAMFQMRAQGEPWVNCTRRAEAMLGYEVHRNFAARIVESRVYLGEASAVVRDKTKPKSSNAKERITAPDAHEAIVTPELWAAASRMKDEGARMPNDGSLAAQALLSGIVYCATCGQKMYIRGRGRNGERKAFYSCARKTRIGVPECEHPANADVKMVDDYVLWILSQDESGALSAVGSSEQRWLEARRAVEAAEADLAFWKDSDASPETRRTEIVRADKAVSDARARLWELDEPEDVGDVIELDGTLLGMRAWGDDKDADRRLLRRYIDRITVKRGNRWQPLDDRIKVVWKDGSEPVIPSPQELLVA
jgi:DNA invertase Pin-like site-specific DNA recombinase